MNYYDYGYDYGYELGSNMNELSPMAIAIIVFFSIIALALAITQLVGEWKTYKKAGRHGWAAIIPFYREWTMLEVGGQHGAYIFFMFIPFVGSIVFLVFQIMALLEIAKRFGKDTGFGILSIFFPWITFPILGLSDAKYNG